MKEYRKVDGLFSGLDAHTAQSRSLIEKAYFDEERNLISAQILCTLDDGTELEIRDMYAFCEYVENRW